VDVHALNQTVFECVDMLDHSVQKRLAGQIAHNLMNADDNAAGRVCLESLRFDVRIKHAPLSRPVLSHAFVTMDRAAFHSIRPNDIRLHRGQRAIQIARVEGLICTLQ